MAGRKRVGALAVTVALVARLAAAQPAPEPTLVPPRVLEDPAPVYPEGETADASVLLEVVVEPDGSSGDVRVVEGGEPFAAAAVAAVRRYRYEPARRGEQVVRARIRLVVTFTAPPPPRKSLPLPDEPPEEAAAKPGEAKPPKPAVEEVTITGTRRPTATPTEHRMGRAEVRLVPGAFGDPYRAIEILPGVIPTVSGLPYYYIRGAPPSAVGYFVEEVRVPYLFHFALGPSVIHPALIDEVSLHPAAFPGRFGRYAGGIVTGKMRDPATEIYGEGNIRLLDMGAYVEAPLAHGRASVGLGGRFSYTGALFSLFVEDTTVAYRDYNGRFAYKIDDRWTASALTFGAYDYVSQMELQPDNVTKRENVLFASEFHRLDLRLDRKGANGADSRIAATVGFDRTRIEADRFAQDIVLGLRGRHRAPVSSEVDVELGGDVLVDKYIADLPSPYAVSKEEYDTAYTFFGPRTDVAAGTWVSGIWHPSKGFDFTATMRGDVFTSDGKTAFGPSPRVSMRVPIVERLAFLGAMGVAPQPPAFAIPVPAINYRGLPGGLGFGYQKSAGFELELPLKFAFKGVGYHHTYFNMRDLTRNRNEFELERTDIPINSPTQAFGAEIFLSRKLSERVGAFVSYTLSRSQLGASQLFPKRVSPFDRTHVFQVGGSIYIGAGWRVSARYLTYRGWPDEGSDIETTGRPRGRLSPFNRLDLRIEKRWDWRKTGYISLVLEGLNVTAGKEVVGRSCGLDAAGQCRNDAIGPITVPSIGVEGAL